MTTASPFVRPREDPIQRLLVESLYLLIGFPIALASFIVLVVGLSLAGGLLIIWVGLPLAAGTLLAARMFAELERVRLRSVGVELPAAAYLPAGRGWRAMFGMLRDPQYWLDLVHGMLVMPVATFTWSVSLVWWVGALAGVTSGLWEPWLPSSRVDGWRLSDLLGMPDVAINTLIGIAFLVTLVPVTRGCTAVHVWLARLLLGNERVRGLQRRVDALTASRAAVVDAEAHALRRLERDIHDGPQQRLVRLGMDLSVAERRLADDPEAARQLLSEARAQTAEALAELRALSRGIAPPILADRGLGAALIAVTARCSVQADLQVGLPDGTRLPPAVENAAYFVVSEALANVAKHSQATHVTVRVLRDRSMLLVEVEDDGIGGAHPAKGHGLQGLADRLAGVDGRLTVSSPPGGPTRIVAEVPCA